MYEKKLNWIFLTESLKKYTCRPQSCTCTDSKTFAYFSNDERIEKENYNAMIDNPTLPFVF